MAWFNHGKSLVLNPSEAAKEAPFLILSDIIRVSLHDETYAMSTDSDEVFTDTSNEITTVTGYNKNNQQLASKTVTRNFTSDRAEFDAADLVFTAIGNGTNDTFHDIIIFRMPDASTASAEIHSNLIAHDDTFSATTTNGGNVTLVWNSSGILHIT